MTRILILCTALALAACTPTQLPEDFDSDFAF